MVKSAMRVLQILEYVSTVEHGVTHSTIASALNIPGSSTTALLRDLRDTGYLLFDEPTGRYSVGPRVLQVSTAYMRNLNIVRVGQPVLLDVHRATGEYASLVISRDLEVIKVCEYVIPDPIAYVMQTGEPGPMHATSSGKAILAFFPKVKREQIVKSLDYRVFTQHTLRTQKALCAELKVIAQTGVAYSREEILEGMISMAVPLFDAEDEVVGAMSVATPTVRFTAKHETAVAAALKEGAKRISARLGHRASLFAA